ncbi:immunoglobulin-like domain-containing protein [Microbacterium sp. lyk4-40-TSB-66]|uniref:immunoglobulin-like domain-containing protein n=1 Tax=Microbacterium sp. lyk4-40-TSB-66 TaxID=3040294 RepID=UPI00254BF626|nr:immunoglobulin-like domain-containing protein [Microbacterium sp. lyk4-40-TSB-66]
MLTPATAAMAAESVPVPVLQYTFDQIDARPANGATVADSAPGNHVGTVVNGGATSVAGPRGVAGDLALSLPGGASTAAAPHVRIAPGLIPAGTTDVTMSAWIRWSGAPACTWPFTLGSSVNAHVLATTQCGASGYGAVKNGSEVRASGTAPVPASRWVHMAVVVAGGKTVQTFLDGALVGQAPTTYTAAAAVGSSTFSGYLGKSFYGPDAYWAGAIDDVKVWTSALSAGQLQQAESEAHAAIARADAAVTLGDTSNVTSDLALTTSGTGGSTITWTSSNPGVVSATGTVVRPAAGSRDAIVTLTPTATHGGTSIAGSPLTVKVPAYAEGDSAQAELARSVADGIAAEGALAGPIRGSITLPTTGADVTATAGRPGAANAAVTWSSSNEAIISAVDEGTAPNIVAKGAVTRPAVDTEVTLTATVTVAGAAPVVRTLERTVPAAAPVAASDLDAYLFAYFTGDNVEGEKIRFATSDGNDSLRWKTLNDAQPILTSTKGTKGLRDPFILRSKEGDRFFLLATDLSVGTSGWGGATNRGSHHLEIWESTDLVNWGEQRHVEVNLPNAGMTWAPEAIYDESIEAYNVYWTSTLFTDGAARDVADGNGPQILISTTRDFRDFTTPQPWFKAADVPGLNVGNGLIDSTVLKEGDTWYRFTKATQTSGCASPDIIGQKSTDLRATTASGAWSLIDTCIGRTAGTPEVEGPEIFAANEGDRAGYKYFLWVDNYGGRGYIPLGTNSLEGDIQWTIPSSFSLPASPRHGSILPITAKERDTLAAKWNPSLLVTSIDPVAASVQAGSGEVSLPETVQATFKDGHRETIAVTWDPADLSSLKKAGDTVEVRGQLANSAGTPAIATVTATAPPGPAVSATASTRCVAGKVVITTRATNDSGAAADITVSTAWGGRTHTAVAPGASVSTATTVRAASVAAGSVEVTATGASGSRTVTAAYSAVSCR